VARQQTQPGFPSINLMPDRERVRGGPPKVRVPFWIALALVTVVLIAVMALQLIPRLVVPR
jgi:hypothetical protein